MKKRQLDQQTKLLTSSIGLGCMGMSEFYGQSDRKESIMTLQKAYDLGVTLFDTADMYGKGENEKLIGEAIKPFRDNVILATKCGIVRDAEGPNTIGLDGSYDYIKEACEASLKRLGVDFIDLFYLHRIDPKTPVEESMRALSDLVKEGKIRYIGLSEVSADDLKKAHRVHSVTALQTEYSLTARRKAEEMLPVCRDLGVTFVAYSPMGRGLLSGLYHNINQLDQNDWRRELPQFQEQNLYHNLAFIDGLKKIADKKGCALAQLSLAWLLAQGDDIIPIPGTRQKKYIQQNCAAVDLILDQNDLKSIELLFADTPPRGQRLPQALMEKFELDY